MAITADSWLDAQYSVLGAALIDPTAVGKVVTETTEQDYSDTCRAVYLAIKQLYSAGVPVDVVTVADKLDSAYTPFLAQLMAGTPTAANVDYYISLCRSQSRVLALRELGLALAEASGEADARALMERANTLLVEKQAVKVATMADMIVSFNNRGQTQKNYIRWPIAELDERLYVEQGDLVILGGYPSAGKSALALQCAALWAKNKRVGFYSLETSSDKLFDRLIAATGNVSLGSIKRNSLTDADWAKLIQSVQPELYNLKLEIIPAAGMSPADIKATAVARRHEIVIIDYLQLLQGSGSSRYEQVTGISLALHTMAQSMGILVVALSQLRRQTENAPNMSSLRESGQLEQDADLILLLYLENQDDENGTRVLRIAKNKEGTCPAIRLDFDGAHQRFFKSTQGKQIAAAYAAQGRAVKNKHRQTVATFGGAQFTVLPENTEVPFVEER